LEVEAVVKGYEAEAASWKAAALRLERIVRLERGRAMLCERCSKRVCSECGALLPVRARASLRTCSERCRKARQRRIRGEAA